MERIGLDKSNMFCSSIPEYRIAIGEKIYERLKTELRDYNVMVVMFLSDNYYNSKPSLNEMGAAWVLSREYHTILLNGFEFKDIEGAIDPQKIGFKVEDKQRMLEFAQIIVQKLGLPNTDENKINMAVDLFYSEIENKRLSQSLN